MGYRRVTIENEVWDVWDVRPELRSGSLGKELENGWLCFQCGQARRRLYPIPQRWQDWADEELATLFEQARPVTLSAAHRNSPDYILPQATPRARGNNAAD